MISSPTQNRTTHPRTKYLSESGEKKLKKYLAFQILLACKQAQPLPRGRVVDMFVRENGDVTRGQA